MAHRPRAGGPSWKQRLLALGGLVIIVGVAVIALLAAGLIGNQSGGEGIENVTFVDPPRTAAQANLQVGAETGKLAPDFQISDFNGVRHKLSEFRGKVVYVNFWGTWCIPCALELPDIYTLLQRHADEVAVIAVNRRDSTGSAKSYLQNRPLNDGGKGVSFTVNGVDPDDTLYNEFIKLLPPPMPASVFIDPNGVVTRIFNGIIRLDDMEGALAEASGHAAVRVEG